MLNKKPTPHDFPEDKEQYENKCCYCKIIFNGYKHRVTCKVCESKEKS